MVHHGSVIASRAEATMMRTTTASITLGIVLCALPALGAETAAEKAAAAILQADREMNRAVEAKAKARFASFLAKDAAFLGSVLARGPNAVVEAWAPYLAADRKSTLRWEPREAHVSSSGDLGYTLGTFTLETADAEGRKETRTGHYVTVWRKQPDGTWQAVADAGSPAQPVKAAE